VTEKLNNLPTVLAAFVSLRNRFTCALMFLLPILEISFGLTSSAELELNASYFVAPKVGEGVGDSESLPSRLNRLCSSGANCPVGK
jgi:hypothetical protein